MDTTVYLIRHSMKFENTSIEKYNTVQNFLLKDEKIVLSVKGEKRAESLSDLEELSNLDKVYASNCVRTLQTAKYILEKQDLKVTIDERFDERRRSEITNFDIYPDWYQRQYLDENFSTVGGESQKDVRNRFEEAFDEMINENKGKRVAIFSHGYAITFFLMKWLKLTHIDEDRNLCFEYNGKTIFNRQLDAPEIFKLIFDDNNNLVSIKNIEVDYKD